MVSQKSDTTALNHHTSNNTYVPLAFCVATFGIFLGSHGHQMLPCPYASLHVCRAQNVSPSHPLISIAVPKKQKTQLDKIRPFSDPNHEFVWLSEGTFSSVQFTCSVVSDSLQPHGLQHIRLPCPSPAPGAVSNSYASSW